jgi:hypothetical protein
MIPEKINDNIGGKNKIKCYRARIERPSIYRCP